MAFPLLENAAHRGKVAAAWDFSRRQDEPSFPAATAWHGWVDPFQHSSGVSLDVSFHPAVKKSPSQPCLTLNIPKNPAGSVGNAALMAVTHFKVSHSPGGGQTTCASPGYPSPPQSTCDTSRGSSRLLPAPRKAPGASHGFSPAIPALHEASGASPRAGRGAGMLSRLLHVGCVSEGDRAAAITFSLENNVPTQPVSGI